MTLVVEGEGEQGQQGSVQLQWQRVSVREAACNPVAEDRDESGLHATPAARSKSEWGCTQLWQGEGMHTAQLVDHL